MASPATIERKWYVVDAEGLTLGRLASKVAVIYDSSDVYSSGIYETFAAEAKNQEFEIVVAEAFTADNKTDFSVQVQKAKDAGAELVFLPIYYQEASLILNEADKQAYDATFFGCDGLDGILSVEGFDTALAEGVMLLTPFAADAEDEATQNFVAAYNEAYGETPIQFAADAYDAIYIIKAGLEKAGATAEMSAEEVQQLDEHYMLVDEAREFNEDAQAGDTLEMEVPMSAFGRQAIQNAKQLLMQSMRDAERVKIQKVYENRIGSLISGEVTRIEGPNLIINLGSTEAILPQREQIRKERWKQGDSVKAVILKIDENAKFGSPLVVLSRTHESFLKELLRQEVPEIYEGIIEKGKIEKFTRHGLRGGLYLIVSINGERIKSLT